MAKKFFYVCAGVLLLLVGFQVGASRVGAQSGGGQFHLGDFGNPVVACPGGDIYVFVVGGGWQFRGNALAGRAGRTIAGVDGAGSYIFVLLDNGELLSRDGTLTSNTWASVGIPACSGATATSSSTWGSLKARYH